MTRYLKKGKNDKKRTVYFLKKWIDNIQYRVQAFQDEQVFETKGKRK